MTDFGGPFFIKVCGVTTLGDANAVIASGANAMGMILAASPRQLSVERAFAISEATKGRIVRTLVFRDNDDDFIRDVLEHVEAEAVQIHGFLSDALLANLRAANVRIIKAMAIGSDEFFGFHDDRVDAVLVDGATPGSGVSHSWAELHERAFDVPVIAAGGLTDANVARVITDSRVWGVDSASGVESSPGVKDRDKVTRFVEHARDAFRERAAT